MNLFARSMQIGQKTFYWGKQTYIMGIINITKDSFSGDGLLADIDETKSSGLVENVLEKAKQFVVNGVDILDIGAESTRPGAEPVAASDEKKVLIPVIHALSQNVDIPISVDTYKSEVAEAAIEAGANIINDVWGLQADEDMAGVLARYDLPVILMHNRSSWAHAEIKEKLGGRYIGIEYDDLLTDVKRELLDSVQLAHDAGIPDSKIILDPGLGFGKTVEQNLELIHRLDEIRALGYPVLLGPSRKSFIGYTLNLPPDERLAGTAALVTVGVCKGVDIVRVHDVAQIKDVVKMTDEIEKTRIN